MLAHLKTPNELKRVSVNLGNITTDDYPEPDRAAKNRGVSNRDVRPAREIVQLVIDDPANFLQPLVSQLDQIFCMFQGAASILFYSPLFMPIL